MTAPPQQGSFGRLAWTWAHAAVFVGLAALVAFHVEIGQPLVDPFQEGEYATLGVLAQGPHFQMPVLIHGALDILPAQAATHICAADHQLVCIRAENEVIEFIASLAFGAIVLLCVGAGRWPGLAASLPAAALLWLFNRRFTLIVDAHQGSPSVRDLMMVLGLLTMTLAAGDEILLSRTPL